MAKILVAEDDMYLRELYSELLAEEGFEVLALVGRDESCHIFQEEPSRTNCFDKFEKFPDEPTARTSDSGTAPGRG